MTTATWKMDSVEFCGNTFPHPLQRVKQHEVLPSLPGSVLKPRAGNPNHGELPVKISSWYLSGWQA